MICRVQTRLLTPLSVGFAILGALVEAPDMYLLPQAWVVFRLHDTVDMQYLYTLRFVQGDGNGTAPDVSRSPRASGGLKKWTTTLMEGTPSCTLPLAVDYRSS